MLKLGPKEMKGEVWDEGGKSEIVQILISHEEDTIRAMQFAYVVDGKVLLSQIYGELTGLNFDRVTFNRPCEYLVSISGEYDIDGTLVSAAFRTNHKKYGPFGGSDDSESGYDKFKYKFGSSFGGFHGSVYNSCVHSIGVYVKPVAVSLSKL
ncbi:jacalin-like lectin domain-containing protein [Artemisia annua]|uniref:Jacalin-like lectin domain-containing protein n=1 Tax=Artemisia annua TaxID=35608 RepID=A0A2U1MI23_ARTAN|nr:jacalin-like lectin domain-containing protein [Artemisia annua]